MATVSVADQLKGLVELQALDGEIYRLEREIAAMPGEAARMKAGHQESLEQSKSAEAQYKTLELKRKEMEISLDQKEEQIKKIHGQLFQVKTNKEYSAMQKEIEGFKADKSVLEEEVLKFMEEIERSKVLVQAEKQVVAGKEAELKAALSRLDEGAKVMKAKADELKASRASIAPKIDPTILSRYERILKGKAGSALVPVRGNACSGCFINLPPQTINEIMLATRLIVCESCARILYIEPSS